MSKGSAVRVYSNDMHYATRAQLSEAPTIVSSPGISRYAVAAGHDRHSAHAIARSLPSLLARSG
jgi:hypothetical protein